MNAHGLMGDGAPLGGGTGMIVKRRNCCYALEPMNAVTLHGVTTTRAGVRERE